MILESTLDYLQRERFYARCNTPETSERRVDITKSVYLNSFLKDVWDEVKRERADVDSDSSKVGIVYF
jgi:hypothetical protein